MPKLCIVFLTVEYRNFHIEGVRKNYCMTGYIGFSHCVRGSCSRYPLRRSCLSLLRSPIEYKAFTYNVHQSNRFQFIFS